MDFGSIPPEINSALMYSGAGAGPMLSAATAWDQLAAELHMHAVSYQSVITGLTTGSWQGPSAVSMAAAAAPYVSWMTATASQCEQVANQARAAVSAYESAFTMTVPPPVIAANRAQLMTLVATNILGQNTPAIMATEAHYGEMWAQDAAAMYGYAGSSAAAATLTPFTPPLPNSNPAALFGHAAAVGHSAGVAAASHAHATASSLSTASQTILGLGSTELVCGRVLAGGDGYRDVDGLISGLGARERADRFDARVRARVRQPVPATARRPPRRSVPCPVCSVLERATRAGAPEWVLMRPGSARTVSVWPPTSAGWALTSPVWDWISWAPMS